jgi:PAS domain S-box-containing protein
VTPRKALFTRRGRNSEPASEDASEATDVRRDRDLEAVASLSSALARTGDAASVARTLLEEVTKLLGVEFASVALIDEDGSGASGLYALENGSEASWWPEIRVDFEQEPSAIASAAFEAAPVAISEVAGSTQVSRRLAERVGAKSAIFVPLIVDERVPAVLIAASTGEPRIFSAGETTLLQALAAETAMALERSRSALALEDALVRERLVASISRKVRSELDLEAVLRVAVVEAGEAANVARSYIRLGKPGEDLPIRAEWDAEGVEPIGSSSKRLPVSNLVAREERTIAIGDTRTDPALDDEALGGRQTLVELGTAAVLATPITIFDELIGVFGFHRVEPTVWTDAEIALAEAVAREVGLAIHTANLLEENTRRLGQQQALLKAAQVVTSELRLETVLQRLVDEVTDLLEADAADCYLLDEEGKMLRCVAVNGLPSELLGHEFPPHLGLSAAALKSGRPALSNDYPSEVQPVPHAIYLDLTGAVVAPMTWSGRARGVLGVRTRNPERRFDENDVELLETFAGLASLAVRNAASFEQSVRQTRVQRGFYGIASALAEPLSQTATLGAVARAANESLGGTAAAVLMPGESGAALVASVELPDVLVEPLREAATGSGSVLASCASERRMLAAPDLADDRRFEETWRQSAAAAGLAALLAIPLDTPRREGGGLVVVFFAEPRAFIDDDLELARRLAGAARGALERSDLYENERTSRALAQQLARLGTLLATELDPAAVLDEVVQQARGLLGADACSIRIVEDDELVVSAVQGAGLETTLDSRTPATGRLAGEIVHARAPVAVSDTGGDGRLVADDPILEAGYRAYLGVPLAGAEGGLQGVLAVYQRRPRAWREDEVEALTALAGNASSVLSNAELYQRVALERERSYAILANIADGIVAVDREGDVVLWNAAAEQITGVPAVSALGRPPLELIQDELAAGGDAVRGERLVPIRRGADEVWLSVTEAIMRDPAGAVAGRIFAFRDVSSERRVEQMKSDFVSTVSHELRAPLTSIYGFAETLLRQDIPFSDEERQTFLGYIASETKQLTTIVDTLLGVARLDAGEMLVELAPADVGTIVNEVVSSAQATANNHRFVVDVPKQPLAATADREKLRQVLANLVDNAVKFSPEGATVTVEARRAGGAVEVRVVDEGIGVPADERERIFSKFHRAEGSARGRAGTGLGLFIARGLVRAMGGRIWVDSAEGQGSSFAFELPLAADSVVIDS